MKKALFFVSLVTVVACSGASALKEEAPGQAEDQTGAAMPNTQQPRSSNDPSAAPGGGEGGTGTGTGADGGASPGPDAKAPADDAGPNPQPVACAGGSAETEPNDTSAKATPIVMGKNCGVTGPADADFFVLSLNGSAKLRFEAASDDLSVVLVDETGFFGVPIPTNESIDVNGQNSKSVFRVTGESKQAYTIVRE